MKKWKKFLKPILIGNVAVAVLAYFIVGDRAKLDVNKQVKDGGVMNYFIAGNLAQASQAFKLFFDGYDSYHIDGGVTCATFVPIGYHPNTIAKQIEDDVAAHNYKARVWTISLGDEVARELEARNNINDLEICSINPCVDIGTVSKGMQILIKIFAIPAELIKITLGVISYIPFISVDGGNYSLSTLVDQYMAIYAFSPPKSPEGLKRTKLVVYSKNDEFLDNDTIAEYFHGVDSVVADTEHGNTVLGKQAYLDAMMPELIKMGWLVKDE